LLVAPADVEGADVDGADADGDAEGSEPPAVGWLRWLSVGSTSPMASRTAASTPEPIRPFGPGSSRAVIRPNNATAGKTRPPRTRTRLIGPFTSVLIRSSMKCPHRRTKADARLAPQTPVQQRSKELSRFLSEAAHTAARAMSLGRPGLSPRAARPR